MTKKTFLACQIAVFAVISVCFFTFAYYLPNLPPFLRPLVMKIGRVDISKEQPNKLDDRFLAWFNRDPERVIPQDPYLIVSPADGFVQHIQEIGGKKHVVIEMRYTDVHVQRVPMKGQVMRIDGEGKPLPADLKIGDYMLDKLMPYQKVTTLSTEIGDVIVRQITSYFAKRIEIFPKKGENVERGQRLGRILAGSTVVIELPLMVEILVKENQDVTGGETVIGRYKQ